MKRDLKTTLWVRLWALRHVFFLWLASPSIVELSATRCAVRIPLNWRTRNHVGSMYIGVLVIGADVAGGLMAFRLMRERRVRASFLFKETRAEFLRRAEGDVVFTCEDGPKITAMFDRAFATGERQNEQVLVVATVPSRLGEEPVARFEMTLSLKPAGARSIN